MSGSFNGYATLKNALVVIGGLCTAFLGGWDTALKTLVLFVVLDYLTGVAAAIVTKTVDSNIGFKGIAKKVLVFVLVGVGYALDQFMGQDYLRSLIIIFYIANEGISIIENLSRTGVPIPQAVLNVLNQLKSKAGEGNDDRVQ